MARTYIGGSADAGNASFSTLFTMPAGAVGFISNITACNTNGSTRLLTLAVYRNGLDNVLVTVDSMLTTAVSFYGKGATKAVCPLVMNAGDILEAKADGPNVTVTFSGMYIS